MPDPAPAPFLSSWLLIDQARVDAFADITRDRQFIHVDPEAAAKTPLGGPIAHGFLTLSLVSSFAFEALPPFEVPGHHVLFAFNYGFDRVRFLAPVHVGKAVRGRFTLADRHFRHAEELLLAHDVEVEIDGEERPALVARWLTLLMLAPA